MFPVKLNFDPLFLLHKLLTKIMQPPSQQPVSKYYVDTFLKKKQQQLYFYASELFPPLF